MSSELSREEAIREIVHNERRECAGWASGIDPERGHSDAFKDGWLAARSEAKRVIESRKDDQWIEGQLLGAIRSALTGPAGTGGGGGVSVRDATASEARLIDKLTDAESRIAAAQKRAEEAEAELAKYSSHVHTYACYQIQRERDALKAELDAALARVKELEAMLTDAGRWLESNSNAHRLTAQASITPGNWLVRAEVGDHGHGKCVAFGKHQSLAAAISACVRDAAGAQP